MGVMKGCGGRVDLLGRKRNKKNLNLRRHTEKVQRDDLPPETVTITVMSRKQWSHGLIWYRYSSQFSVH
ncbi:hypothetical protein MUK42_05560 [Musa troglodytarum]|uniref:Uncharacterized protein n=1 Tax=Musa troglodytarum TaxID=320322 RepID=A0A9E7GV91_9LILI|nr:hypothetical protein MUK42_05560 [Musa troglodytarum]